MKLNVFIDESTRQWIINHIFCTHQTQMNSTSWRLSMFLFDFFNFFFILTHVAGWARARAVLIAVRTEQSTRSLKDSHDVSALKWDPLRPRRAPVPKKVAAKWSSLTLKTGEDCAGSAKQSAAPLKPRQARVAQWAVLEQEETETSTLSLDQTWAGDVILRSAYMRWQSAA